MNKKLSVSCIFLLIAMSGWCLQSNKIQGIVYHDKNKNGQRDSNETGIAGVAVSDQVQVVKTDAQGNMKSTI
jgi:Tfp pilus assembly protein FimT